MPWLFWLIAIPVLGILILLHEIGHFYAARWMKVRIEEFGIGFPPRMLTLGTRNGVRYTLNWLPLGGFVRLAGEEDPTVEGSLAGKKPWQRVVVLSAGALMNLLVAFLLFTGLAIYGREEVVTQQVGIYRVEPGTPAEQAGLLPGDIISEINGKRVTSYEVIQLEIVLNRGYTVTLGLDRDGQHVGAEVVPRKEHPEDQGPVGIRMAYYESPVTVQQVVDESPAAWAGLRPGDTVLAIDGQPVHNSLDYLAYLDDHLDQQVTLSVQRKGQLLAPVTLDNDSQYAGLPLGVSYLHLVRRHHGPAEGWRQTVAAALLVPRVLAGIFRGSVPVSDLSGPVGIVYAAGQATQQAGLYGLVNLAAVISINLGLINLFPLPAMDGGRLVFVFLEWLRRGKRLSPEKEGLVHLIGFFLLLGLVGVLTYYDIVRIAGGGIR